METALIDYYKRIAEKYRLHETSNNENIFFALRDMLRQFMLSHNNVAIYCYGKHTRMLMADFMAELKNVKYIIDNYMEIEDASGFQIIKRDQIQESKIDGIIISSYMYKDVIFNELKEDYPDIAVLDIYEKLKDYHVYLKRSYYSDAHPYHFYSMICEIKSLLANPSKELNEIKGAYYELIKIYIRIKDFMSAIQCATELYNISNDENIKELVSDLSVLLETELKVANKISSDNVIMVCFDGMRRDDLSEDSMPKLAKILRKYGRWYENAYSYSTSTFESLIPVYSGNTDLRTRYYEKTEISEDEALFFSVAKNQNRSIFFYTDSANFIKSDCIHYSPGFQTATEKIWNFLIDASDISKGLFYIHFLYESHFSFPNPYSKAPLIADGSAMLFDYLEKNGGTLRTDYITQHKDSLRYLDDVLSPFFENLQCRFVLYADHGNMVLPHGTELNSVDPNYLTCHEDWIRVPLIVVSSEMMPGDESTFVSLLELPCIIKSLLMKEPFNLIKKPFVKIGRSELYNPDFKYLYKVMNQEGSLLAFEGFIFEQGYKLIIRADGSIFLYDLCDRPVEDKKLQSELYNTIKDKVTVFDVARQ